MRCFENAKFESNFETGELKFIVVDVNAKAKTLLEECKNGNLQLGTLIIMEALTDEVKDLAKETGTTLKTFNEIMEIGKEKLKDFVVSYLLL